MVLLPVHLSLEITLYMLLPAVTLPIMTDSFLRVNWKSHLKDKFKRVFLKTRRSLGLLKNILESELKRRDQQWPKLYDSGRRAVTSVVRLSGVVNLSRLCQVVVNNVTGGLAASHLYLRLVLLSCLLQHVLSHDYLVRPGDYHLAR